MGFMFNLSRSIRFAENAGKYALPSDREIDEHGFSEIRNLGIV